MSFERAVNHVNTASDMGLVNNEGKAKLYALYKQATVGDVRGEQPAFIYFEARVKYEAWAKVRGIPPNKAKDMYVALLASLDPRFKTQS